MMKSSLDHMPEKKQRELARVLDILHEEFEDALKGGAAEFKKKGRILKIILFGSYARGGWVDEPYTAKGYRSDFDLLIVVNNRKLCDFAAYWYKAKDRIIRDHAIETPVSFIVHSRREVNGYLREGQYFFSDIRKEGIVLYELDDEPLAEPKPLSPQDRLRVAREHFESRFPIANRVSRDVKILPRRQGTGQSAAFELHQALEQLIHACSLHLTRLQPALAQHRLPALARRGTGPAASRKPSRATSSATAPGSTRSTKPTSRRATHVTTRSARKR